MGKRGEEISGMKPVWLRSSYRRGARDSQPRGKASIQARTRHRKVKEGTSAHTNTSPGKQSVGAAVDEVASKYRTSFPPNDSGTWESQGFSPSFPPRSSRARAVPCPVGLLRLPPSPPSSLEIVF